MMGNPLQEALRVSDEGNANLMRASAWMCAFRLAAFLPVILLATSKIGRASCRERV